MMRHQSKHISSNSGIGSVATADFDGDEDVNVLAASDRGEIALGTRTRMDANGLRSHMSLRRPKESAELLPWSRPQSIRSNPTRCLESHSSFLGGANLIFSIIFTTLSFSSTNPDTAVTAAITLA